MVEKTKVDAPKVDAPTSKVNLADFHHCFRCGFGEEYGAKLVDRGNEKVCQNCRKAEVEKEFN